jgi:DNA-binding XRE family transcriptional regulator
MRNRNVIGPEIRRLRSRREMSQNDLAIKLQILGMEEAMA